MPCETKMYQPSDPVLCWLLPPPGISSGQRDIVHFLSNKGVCVSVRGQLCPYKCVSGLDISMYEVPCNCHFTSRVPEKELIPGIIKQGGNCLESRAQDTTGNMLVGMGNCKGTVSNPPVTQVRQASVWCFVPASAFFITGGWKGISGLVEFVQKWMKEEFGPVNDFNNKKKKKLCPSLRAPLTQQTQQSGIE